MRGKPEKFADHYTQATLFYNSQTPAEKAHIRRAFRFELTKVQVPAIRERVVAMIANVDTDLAVALASDLGMKEVPEPLPKALKRVAKPEIEIAPSLSLFALPGETGIRTRRVAILIADGVAGGAAQALHAGLTEEGAVPRYLGPRLGSVKTEEGDAIEVELTLETAPSVLFDAVAVPGGQGAVKILGNLGHAAEFLKDQYRHAKPILVLGDAASLAENAGILEVLPSGKPDPGVLVHQIDEQAEALTRFVKAIARHRHPERQTDPPEV